MQRRILMDPCGTSARKPRCKGTAGLHSFAPGCAVAHKVSAPLPCTTTESQRAKNMNVCFCLRGCRTRVQHNRKQQHSKGLRFLPDLSRASVRLSFFLDFELNACEQVHIHSCAYVHMYLCVSSNCCYV